MAGEDKFGKKPDAMLRCEEWEALLADALDGLLRGKEAAAFTVHSENCANCGDLLQHAQQGREWLVYLHEEPEIPAGLLGKILDKTAGPGAMPLPVVAGAGPSPGAVAMAMPWRRSFHETRLLMTVAMAFFSIALTLNLVGVKLTNLRLADLRPAEIGNTISRGFYRNWGSVVQFYNNARFVYELESRVRELRRNVEQQQPPQQEQKKQEPQKQGGNSQTGPGGGGAMLNATQVTGFRSQVTEESAELAAQSMEERGAWSVERREVKTTTEVQVSAVDELSISLGQSRTGLQDRYDRRSLV